MGDKLLLVQWPDMIGNDAFFFEQFGFKVTCIYILYLKNIVDIDSSLGNDGLSLGDFDVVVLSLASGPPPMGDKYVFTNDSLQELKDKISIYEAQSGKRITVVGKNLGLSERLEVNQSKMFGGLFIGHKIPFEKISLVLKGISYLVL